MRRLGFALLLMLALGCGPQPESIPNAADDFVDGRTLVQTFRPHRRPPRVDLILVVDDSPSMRPFSQAWADNLDALAQMLTGDQPGPDIRVAITTTSVPGPTCAGPRARGGEPLVESCRAHLDDFVGPDEHGELGGGVEDLRGICQQVCSLVDIPRVPSLGHDDHDLHSLGLRPWIEAPHNPFHGNLDGVSFTEALTCAGLVGFAGCSFESPIEAAARMVEHTADPAHPMFEFRRDDAILYIVTIGDEDDCSHPDSSASMFDPAGDRVFWSDPGADAPTSGVCSNAALECDEHSCTLTDHGLDGTPTDNPSTAVLTAPTRLHDALVAAGEFDEPDWVPIVANVGGFSGFGEVYYTVPDPPLSEADQSYLEAFGVLPGCVGSPSDPHLRAGPGGRVAAVATPGAQLSICEPVWTPAFEAFAERIKSSGPPPWCAELGCIADLDPSTELLEPDCVLEELDYREQRIEIPTCLRDEAGWVIDEQSLDYVPPAGADLCWAWQTDTSLLTADLGDDMSYECVDAQLPAELRVLRRPGSYLARDSVYQLRCRPCG